MSPPSNKRREPRAEMEPALRPRKRPVQKRAIASYERILAAAYELLRMGDEAELTTNSVALRAGVSVGSLYEYFPSKEAIIAALFERKLSHVRSHVPAIESYDPRMMNWREFAVHLARAMKEAEETHEVNFHNLNTVWTSAGLKRLDRAHAEWMADQFASGMRHFGSTWPDDALFDLGINIYSLDACTWFYWRLLGDYSDLAHQRAISAMLAMMEPAMDGSPPPTGPLVTRQTPSPSGAPPVGTDRAV